MSSTTTTTTSSSEDPNGSGAESSFHWHYGELDDKNFQFHGRSLILVIAVFSLLLFLTLLCLYTKWAWRYRRAAVTVSSSSSPADNSSAGGLGREAIDRLPVRLHEGEEALCSICLGGVAEGKKVKVMLGCGHGFHPECVDEWLRGHSTCPLCRSSVQVLAVADQAVLGLV